MAHTTSTHCMAATGCWGRNELSEAQSGLEFPSGAIWMIPDEKPVSRNLKLIISEFD